MLTVLEAIQKTTEFLEKKGIESARFNAEMMLAKILEKSRLELYLSFDRPLNDKETDLYREYLKRRAQNEPLQYILGDVEFYGLKFLVDKSVLIPRQETEILVESVICSCDSDSMINILDIGTGSGIIAISLAKNIENCRVTALDISEEAIETAKKNAQLNEVSEKIEFIKADIKSDELNLGKYDIVVSNPPYISIEEYSTLEPELVNYEPKKALTDDLDGLTFYKCIIEKSKNLLNENGRLFFEMGKGQHLDIKSIFDENNYKNIELKNDYLNIVRVISGVLN